MLEKSDRKINETPSPNLSKPVDQKEISSKPQPNPSP